MTTKKTIRVRPVPGQRVMFHDRPRVLDTERDVPAHPHYTRAIARGELELVTEAAPKPAPKAKSKEG